MSKTSKCKHCGKSFEMGDNGTVDGCDKCTGVQRDKKGYAWKAGETEQAYRPVGVEDDSQDFVVTREEELS